MSIKEDQLRAAADGGVYWFTEWDGEVVAFMLLEEAERAAFENCLAVHHDLKESHDGRITGMSITIFKGRDAASQVSVRSFASVEPRCVWSPPEWPAGAEVSPEEFAHLIQRRSEQRGTE